MSKSIYDEVLDILVDSFKDPQDEDNDCFMFNFRQIIKIEKVVIKAQKQEKLLKKLQEKIIKLSSFIESSAILKYEDLLMFYKEIKEQLKELENEKE